MYHPLAEQELDSWLFSDSPNTQKYIVYADESLEMKIYRSVWLTEVKHLRTENNKLWDEVSKIYQTLSKLYLGEKVK